MTDERTLLRIDAALRKFEPRDHMLPSPAPSVRDPREVWYLNSASYSPLPLRRWTPAARVGRKASPGPSMRFRGRQHERARIAAARLIMPMQMISR